MKKQLNKELRPFWMSYLLLLALIMLGLLIPNGHDLNWPYGVFFYVPFIFFGVYLYGLVLGISVQRKMRNTTKTILITTVIHLIFTTLLLLPPCLGGIITNGILYHDVSFLFPTIGSTLLFFIGSLITKKLQQRRLKSIDAASKEYNEEGA